MLTKGEVSGLFGLMRQQIGAGATRKQRTIPYCDNLLKGRLSLLPLPNYQLESDAKKHRSA
jgi:hypothetical protein